ncbi:hypothetical protein SAMN04488524_0540 [Pedobacter africanus]|uniref:DUF202 domain-containing protein n=1 Tax=Pedobacter africanus TaxID=151894 RepID=A0A1W1ZBS7_9SPHI|nr:hypothetical protein SAMN04488524_0540 [Pedobacter africanus]
MKPQHISLAYLRLLAAFLVCTIAGSLLKIFHIGGLFGNVLIGMGMLIALISIFLLVYNAFFRGTTK